TPRFPVPDASEVGQVTVVSDQLAELPWMWILIAIGAALFLLIIIALLLRRGRSEKPTPSVVPSFAPAGPTFMHTCVKSGGVLQLPQGMKGQSFQCAACGRSQTAGA